uniref:Uncharacterized protein n=1 Tax=Cacopsylla melanoneura TaxID=428564 RepID=A0A8D8TUM1_9HEMI
MISSVLSDSISSSSPGLCLPFMPLVTGAGAGTAGVSSSARLSPPPPTSSATGARVGSGVEGTGVDSTTGSGSGTATGAAASFFSSFTSSFFSSTAGVGVGGGASVGGGDAGRGGGSSVLTASVTADSTLAARSSVLAAAASAAADTSSIAAAATFSTDSATSSFSASVTDSSLDGVFSGLLLSFFEKLRDRKDHFFLDLSFFFLSEDSVADSGEAGVSGVAGVSLSAAASVDFSGVLSTPFDSFSVTSLTSSVIFFTSSLTSSVTSSTTFSTCVDTPLATVFTAPSTSPSSILAMASFTAFPFSPFFGVAEMSTDLLLCLAPMFHYTRVNNMLRCAKDVHQINNNWGGLISTVL